MKNYHGKTVLVEQDKKNLRYVINVTEGNCTISYHTEEMSFAEFDNAEYYTVSDWMNYIHRTELKTTVSYE